MPAQGEHRKPKRLFALRAPHIDRTPDDTKGPSRCPRGAKDGALYWQVGAWNLVKVSQEQSNRLMQAFSPRTGALEIELTAYGSSSSLSAGMMGNGWEGINPFGLPYTLREQGRKMTRLTDNDRKLGPITYARTDWKPLRLVFSTGDREEEERARNTLTAYAFGWCARVFLPTRIEPYSIRHKAGWDAATVARMGRDWWEETFPREYGFSLHEGFLQIFHGPQTHESRTTKSWSWFLPWTQWRHVRFSLYDLHGVLFWERRQKKDIRGIAQFTDQWDAKKACPSASFIIHDFDGEQITARTVIEEREWRFGEGYFRWLSWFRKPLIRRSLDIEFSKETGPEKGSWKGGTCGTGIDMLAGELHEDAFKRYCAQTHKSKSGNYQVNFIGAAA